jgi:GT2 family glycosyltransferase
LRDDSPFNFSALNNRAANQANGEFLCLLNNDIEVITPDWLDELVSLAAQPGTGAVGARLWYPNDTLQHGGVLFGLGGVAGHMHHALHRWQQGYFGRAVVTQNLSAVTAACLVIRKSTYEAVEGFDEKLAVAFNDVDFCAKVLKAGYRNVWTPHAELYHYESASRGSDMDPDKYQRFVSEVRLLPYMREDLHHARHYNWPMRPVSAWQIPLIAILKCEPPLGGKSE